MNLDKLKDRLGGEWYDVWLIAIDERFDPYPKWAGEPDFFDLINQGWLDMYYEPPTDLERKEAFLKKITVNSNPYYNEKYEI